MIIKPPFGHVQSFVSTKFCFISLNVKWIATTHCYVVTLRTNTHILGLQTVNNSIRILQTNSHGWMSLLLVMPYFCFYALCCCWLTSNRKCNLSGYPFKHLNVGQLAIRILQSSQRSMLYDLIHLWSH